MESCIQQFQYYRVLGDRTFSQLSDSQLFESPDEVSNSIAIMVNHMKGNMLSRWTDFLTSDGEKEWRHRDREFEEVIETREQLLAAWNEGWDCLFNALSEVNETNFDTIVYIRNQGHTVVEAVLRQLAHYSYHVGQIVYLGRSLKGSDWKSLSIPKGESSNYNKGKFAQEKRREHFTKEFLPPDEKNG